METGIKETLEDRGKDYGDYAGGTMCRMMIMSTIIARYKQVHGKPMNLYYQIMILDIVNKLSRIASTPDHKDSWHDIAGYALLIEESLDEI